jgi:hypothetical protein
MARVGGLALQRCRVAKCAHESRCVFSAHGYHCNHTHGHKHFNTSWSGQHRSRTQPASCTCTRASRDHTHTHIVELGCWMVQQAALGKIVGFHSNTLDDFNDLFALAWLQNGARCRSIVVFHDALSVLACVRAWPSSKVGVCPRACVCSSVLRNRAALAVFDVVLLLVREAREREAERGNQSVGLS